MSEPRTVTLSTLDAGDVALPEPRWCAGHAEQSPGYRVDITHDGPEHSIAPGGRELFIAFVTQGPFSSGDRSVGLYIEVANLTGTCTPEEVEQLADDLVEGAGELRALGRQLAEILAEGGR